MAASKDASPSLETHDQHDRHDPDSQPTGAAEGTPTEDQTASDDTGPEMPPSGKPRPNTARREAELGSLLGPVEKTELTALVTRVTELMLKQVTQLFDPVRAEEKTEASRIASWGRLPYYLKDLSLGDAPIGSQAPARGTQRENTKPPPSRSKKAGRAADKRDAVPSATSTPGQHQDTDVTPRLQELKKEALQHFKKWQMTVHRRIGEISIKKAADGPGSNGSRGRPPPNRRGKPGGKTRSCGLAATAC